MHTTLSLLLAALAFTSHVTASCKRGVSVPPQASQPATQAQTNNVCEKLTSVSWIYNWSPAPFVSGNTKEYVPMYWGARSANEVQWANAASDYVLGFNEPNFASQANLTPQQAADLWPQVEAFAASHGNAKIVSPAGNYCGEGCNVNNPIDWLQQFFALCPSCKVDYIGFHWYTTDATQLEYIINWYYTTFGKQLWLTETAAPDGSSVEDNTIYMNQIIPSLEEDTRIFRYAWFSAGGSALYDAAGDLTALGNNYNAFASSC